VLHLKVDLEQLNVVPIILVNQLHEGLVQFDPCIHNGENGFRKDFFVRYNVLDEIVSAAILNAPFTRSSGDVSPRSFRRNLFSSHQRFSPLLVDLG
jgi:hypothetical protein